jgi:hypothetical protein
MVVKPIRLSEHAHGRLARRGATENEVRETIRTSSWGPAGLGRVECRRDFPYKAKWNGKFYNTKQVRPIFAEEQDEIVVVTVYVYYF